MTTSGCGFSHFSIYDHVSVRQFGSQTVRTMLPGSLILGPFGLLNAATSYGVFNSTAGLLDSAADLVGAISGSGPNRETWSIGQRLLRGGLAIANILPSLRGGARAAPQIVRRFLPLVNASPAARAAGLALQAIPSPKRGGETRAVL